MALPKNFNCEENLQNFTLMMCCFFQIIWFTALFPYFVMSILLVRAVTLPGAGEGLWYYIKVDWDKLFDGKTWIDGATQIFFAYSVGMGALPALGSYNKFHHDCFKYDYTQCEKWFFFHLKKIS